jgi:hypothetical protein
VSIFDFFFWYGPYVALSMSECFLQEAFRKVYEWKFINSLELWTDAIRAYSSQSDFKQLAYPLTQIISGVARLVPTARYFPLRLRCIRMLNKLAASNYWKRLIVFIHFCNNCSEAYMIEIRTSLYSTA